jgi:hypothetical protein
MIHDTMAHDHEDDALNGARGLLLGVFVCLPFWVFVAMSIATRS